MADRSEPKTIWRTAWDRTLEHWKGQLAVGLVLGLVVSIIDCQQQDQPCDVRTPVITVLVFAAWLLLVGLWNLVVKAPRLVASAALDRETATKETRDALAAELQALKDTATRRRDIRNALGEFLSQGDILWGLITQERQMYRSHPQDYVDALKGLEGQTPLWFRRVQEWADEVEQFLRETPEMGQAYADMFDSQSDLPVVPDPRINMDVRMEAAMVGLKTRQGRLREYISDFKGLGR